MSFLTNLAEDQEMTILSKITLAPLGSCSDSPCFSSSGIPPRGRSSLARNRRSSHLAWKVKNWCGKGWFVDYLNWTCGILSMGAAGPRGKSLVLASWPWGAPPTPHPPPLAPPSPSRDPSLTDLLLLSWPGPVLPSMVAMGVICS